MNKHWIDMVQYRCERARETMAEARLLAEAGYWNTCVNRLYYACFYAVSALLLQNGLSSSKHRGIRSFFNKHFVHTGKVPVELAEIYNDLFERRQEGDYIDFVRFSADEVSPWISQADKLVHYILTYIAEHDR